MLFFTNAFALAALAGIGANALPAPSDVSPAASNVLPEASNVAVASSNPSHAESNVSASVSNFTTADTHDLAERGRAGDAAADGSEIVKFLHDLVEEVKGWVTFFQSDHKADLEAREQVLGEAADKLAENIRPGYHWFIYLMGHGFKMEVNTEDAYSEEFEYTRQDFPHYDLKEHFKIVVFKGEGHLDKNGNDGGFFNWRYSTDGVRNGGGKGDLVTWT